MKEDLDLWSKVMWYLMKAGPSANACSGVPTPDLDAAFTLMEQARLLIRGEIT